MTPDQLWKDFRGWFAETYRREARQEDPIVERQFLAYVAGFVRGGGKVAVVGDGLSHPDAGC